MEQNAVVNASEGTQAPANAPPQTERIISALLAKPTLAAAAQELGINASTLYRAMRHPGLQAEYRNARRQIVSHAIAQVQQNTGKAVETLQGVLADANAPIWARIAAARATLEFALKAVEFEDTEARLSAIEGTLREIEWEQGGKSNDRKKAS